MGLDPSINPSIHPSIFSRSVKRAPFSWDGHQPIEVGLYSRCKDFHGGVDNHTTYIFPQQRKLMGSSAQNSSGVHWCRRRVRFNEVPEKVPEKVWEALVQSQVRFNRVPEKVPEKVPGSLGAKPSQAQQGSGEGS